MSKRYRKAALLLVLTLSLSLPGVAQTGGWRQRVSDRLEKLGRQTREYIHGEPWTYDGQLYTTHREILLIGGRVGVIDQYVSPSAHTGDDLRVSLGVDRPYFADRWHLRQELDLGIGMPKNKANGTPMYLPGLYTQTAFAYTLLERSGLRVEVAPAWSLTVQGNLKLSNSNNVANVKATTGLDAWSRLSYRIPWETLPMRLSYTISLPLLHIAYHPDYGQSYYEYVSGDNRAPIRLYLTAPHNSWSIRQRLLLELPIHSTTWVVGLQHIGTTEHINHTKYQLGSVGLVLGLTLETSALSGGRALRSAHISSSY